MILVCRVILQQNHVTNESRNLMGRSSPSRQVTILPCLVAKSTLVIEIMVLVCHMTLQDHVIKVLYKFGDHGQFGSGDIMVLVCHVILQSHLTKGSGKPPCCQV